MTRSPLCSCIHTNCMCVIAGSFEKGHGQHVDMNFRGQRMTEMKEWLWVSLEGEGRKDDRSEALRLTQSTFNGICTFGNVGCGRLYTSRIHVVDKGQLLFFNMSCTIIPLASAQEVHTCRDYKSEQRWAQWYQVYIFFIVIIYFFIFVSSSSCC